MSFINVEEVSHKDASAMDMETFRKIAKYPLVKTCDMTADVREDAIDIITAAVEKHVADLEKCTKVRHGADLTSCLDYPVAL